MSGTGTLARVQVLVAPDSFGGTLSAVEVAGAIATGWRRGRLADQVEELALSDGGPGFVDAMYNALGGDLLPVTVRDPLARPVPGVLLLVGGTAYVESAQACGLHLLAAGERDPMQTSSYGVGELLTAALDTGAQRVVVGLGGSGTNDGGRGMLGALGLREHDTGMVDRSGLHPLLGSVDLVAATDVDNPLLGPQGASVVFGPQKGAGPETVVVLEARMRRWAAVLDPGAAELAGAGAAGGLGYALLAVGARRESGFGVVADAVGLAARLGGVDLVLTGEGCFDQQSLRGKVCAGVVRLAQAAGVPCAVLAGQVRIEPDQAVAAGMQAVYSVADEVSSVEEAMAHPAEGLVALAERVAREWPPGAGS
ncbi:MAG: glycerate 2-kinase [Frankiales bacterium]|jgi:glycerate kinase|nr:glycerate 2-kinase [Frankiales bacterium]